MEKYVAQRRTRCVGLSSETLKSPLNRDNVWRRGAVSSGNASTICCPAHSVGGMFGHIEVDHTPALMCQEHEQYAQL